MDENGQTLKVRSPLTRELLIASLACLVALMLCYGAFSKVVSELQVWWVELLVYAAVPVFLTFFLLYRSCWHPEITGAPRTCSLLLLSCAILAGDIFTVGAVIFLAIVIVGFIGFGVNAFTGGNH
jgi:hypothetical protein